MENKIIICLSCFTSNCIYLCMIQRHLSQFESNCLTSGVRMRPKTLNSKIHSEREGSRCIQTYTPISKKEEICRNRSFVTYVVISIQSSYQHLAMIEISSKIIKMMKLPFSKPRRWRSLLERPPRKRKVGCSNLSSDIPKSLKQELLNARHQV